MPSAVNAGEGGVRSAPSVGGPDCASADPATAVAARHEIAAAREMKDVMAAPGDQAKT
jgi:hypothetical protein